MAQEFRLPDIGEGLAEADIVRWLVAVGDTVEVDQIVVEVETAKAVVELPCPFAGVVLRLGADEGETIEVGSTLIVIGDAGETAGDSGDAPDAESADEQPATGPSLQAPAPIVGTLAEDAEDLTPAAPPERASGGRMRALPLVRKMARELGVDIASVRPSGPDGKITRDDVRAAASGSPPVSRESQPTGGIRGDERRPLSRLRRTIASNMARSWSEIPHVTTFDQVDATRLLQVRDALSTRHQEGIPVDALIVKAVVPALSEFPEFNATLDGDDLIVHGAAHIGIAVDTPDGLLVAVIRDAGSKRLMDLAGEVRRLGEGARHRTLAPDELTGQTFTVSNIGAVGGGLGTPIVPPGTTAILSVGRAAPAPVARGGSVEVADVMPLSLSYDHRVIDGAVGRRFMAVVLENLAEPALFLA